jgi:MFS family permease
MDGVAAVLVLWQIASLVYPMTWSFYCIAQLGWTPGMIGASLAAVGVMIALGQVFVVGPAVARFGERDAATLGILVAVVVYVGYAFTTSTIGAFLLLIPVALQAPVQPSLMAMMSRRATAETQGEVQGISAMAMGLGQLVRAAASHRHDGLFYRRWRAGAFSGSGLRRRGHLWPARDPDAAPPAARDADGRSDAAVGHRIAERFETRGQHRNARRDLCVASVERMTKLAPVLPSRKKG